jgi:hypothetical protein
MSNVIISDIDIIDIKLTDILQLSEQAKLFFKNISENYNLNLFNIYLNIINDKFDINLLKLPILNNIYNNDFSNPYIIPVVNDTKYRYGNAVIFNTNGTIEKVNWGDDKIIGSTLKLNYYYNLNLYEKNGYYFIDFFDLLDNNKLITNSIYHNNDSGNSILPINNKTYVIRNCTNCIQMVGYTYNKGKNVIDDYRYINSNFDDRVILKNENINIIGYQLNPKYIIKNLVYIPKLKDHGFINNVQNDKYDVYILADNKIHQFTKNQIEFLEPNKTYLFKNDPEKVLYKLIPSLENILYSIHYKNNIYSLDTIIEIIKLYDYKLNDLSICNINLVGNLINDKIEDYKNSLISSKFKYNYYYDYYLQINDINNVNDLILFYLNNISILIPEIKITIDDILKNNKDNILLIFDDIINNSKLLCHNYIRNIFICDNIILHSNLIQTYKLKKYINNEIFITNIHKIIELIIFNHYYTFIEKYYTIENINLYNNPLYHLSYWLHNYSTDNGTTYYLKSYLPEKSSTQKIIKELKELSNTENISSNNIVKEYYNIDDLINDNNKDYILYDLQYTSKNDVLLITIKEFDNIILNGYRGANIQHKEFYNKINKSYMVNYILSYNKRFIPIQNNLYYTLSITGKTKNNQIQIPMKFVSDDDLCVLHNKYYIRKNNQWILFNDYDYANLYNSLTTFNYKEQLDYLSNKNIFPGHKYYNTLYDKSVNQKLNSISNLETIEEKLNIHLCNHDEDIDSNVEFNILGDNEVVNLEDYINKIDYKDGGYKSAKELNKLKYEKYGDYKIVDETKIKIDSYSKHDIKTLLDGFRYYFKYEFVPSISNISTLIPGTNRAFYKCYDLMLPYKEFFNKKTLYGSFTAEAPGNFIHCIRYLRNNMNWKDFKILTLIEDMNLMHQNNFYKKFDKQLVYNKNNNGDVTKKSNLLELKKEMLNITNGNLADIATADGGFDMDDTSSKYNFQEIFTSKLVFGEIIAAIITQAEGGMFILKVFDMFSDLLVKMLFLLNLVYDKVLVTKPINSRMANAEKYIHCIGFKYKPNDPIRLQLEEKLLDIIDNWGDMQKDDTYKIFELFPSIKLSDNYTTNMKDANNYLSKLALFTINKTFESFKDVELKILINKYKQLTQRKFVNNLQYFESRISTAKKYCIKYGLPYSSKYDNISRCPHHEDLKNASNTSELKNVIFTYKINENDEILLRTIYQLTYGTDLPSDFNQILLMFKNEEHNLDPRIKNFLGNFICKYCYEPIICKHYNLLPNTDEIINYYGIYNDAINCYVCGEHLANIDDAIEDFSKSGNLIQRINADDLEFQKNNGKKENVNETQIQIDQYYKIYKYKQNVANEDISLMNLIFTNLNQKYLKDDYRPDDIYIIYNFLYNDFLKEMYNDISKIISDNILSFDIYKNIFKDLLLISKNDNNNVRSIKTELQKTFKVPPLSNKSELINYMNNFYNNIYLYYYNHYFAIILFSINVFKLLITNSFYIDSSTKKIDNPLNMINDINFNILDKNVEFNLFTTNTIIFTNLNLIINSGLNSSQYNNLFNIANINSKKDPLTSKSILVILNNTIETFLKSKFDNYLETYRIIETEKPKTTILPQTLTNFKTVFTNYSIINLNNTLKYYSIFDEYINIEISYIDKLRILSLFHYEDNFIGQSRIFNKNNIDLNTQLSKNQIMENVSLLNFSEINKLYNSILDTKKHYIQLSSNISFEKYYDYIAKNLNISFKFDISSDLDIINHFKNKIPKQNLIKHHNLNNNIIKYNSILHNIKKIIAFISNYKTQQSFYSKYFKYKPKYQQLYENLLEYLLNDFYLFDNYNTSEFDNNILLLCIYIKDNILNKYNFDNNGNNYILSYIYPYLLNTIVLEINNISSNNLSKYLKSQAYTSIAKLINNLDNYKTKIFSIIQLIINTIETYKFKNNVINIINITEDIDTSNFNLDDFEDSIDIASDGVNENNINFINRVNTIEDQLDSYNDDMQFDQFEFEDMNDDDYEYKYDD